MKYLTVTAWAPCTNGSHRYFSWIPELQGCMSDGETVEEAEKNLSEACVLMIKSMKEDDVPVPETINGSYSKIIIDLGWICQLPDD